MPYLGPRELKEFLKYKHSSPKTTLELFLVNRVWGPFEKHCIPDVISANSVTLIGQAPLFLLSTYLLTMSEVQDYKGF